MFRKLLKLFGLTPEDEPMGQVLLRAGVITGEQLKKSLDIQRETKQMLGRIIVDEKFATEFDVLQAISKYSWISASTLADSFQKSHSPKPTGLADRIAALRLPIRVKLSIALTFMIWLTILTLSMVILARQRENLYNQTMRTGKVSLGYFTNDSAVPLLEDDIVRLNSLIKDSASVEGLVYASIISRDGVVKAHTDTSRIGKAAPAIDRPEERKQDGEISTARYRTPEGRHLLNLSRPIAFSGKVLGEANVGVSLDFIDDQIRRESVFIIILSLFIVLLGISIAVMIGIGFAKPISQLVLATQEIGKGNFQHRIDQVRGDEFGDLASAFNYMAQELRKKLKMQKSFGSYVSPEILKMLMAHPEDEWLRGSRMEVSIVFTDIRGFTAFAESNDPEVVVEGINEYFSIATKCIDDMGGYVDKFIGDAVLGVFGAPIARPDHAERAIRAALAMQEEFRRRGDSKNPFLSRIGIGVNSGMALAGDLGSEVKKNYSVIGDSVNVAARINSLAAGGQTIITRSTLTAVGDIVEVTPLSPTTVKGKTEPLEIYELKGLKEGRGPKA